MKKRMIMLLILAIPLGAVAQRTDLSGLTFCIDPGHGGYFASTDRLVVPDPGINFWESESNFEKALLLKSMLEAKGATVILTRYTNDYPTDAEPTLAERVATANSNNADFFHSIHSNATGLALNTSSNYTLMLVREKRPGGAASGTGNGLGIPETDAALQVASVLSPAIRATLRTQSSSTWLDWTFYGGTSGGFSLGVLRGLNMPGELSEGSMHDYYPETRRLMNNDYHKMEMYAIRNTLMQFYGVPADQRCIIAGIQRDIATSAPINSSRVRILPENIVKTGDLYNNGFYMFDSLAAGLHTVRFETPGYTSDSVQVSVAAGGVVFADRTLMTTGLPAVMLSSPVEGDTAFAMNQPIKLTFNKPMDTASVRAAMSITPPLILTLAWSNGNTQLVSSPAGYIPFGVAYVLTIDTTAHSIDGKKIDGLGSGIGSAPYLLHFRARYLDLIPPRLVARYPDSMSTVRGGNQIITLTFDKILDPSSISLTNVALQRVGGSVLGRSLQSWSAGGKTGLNVYPSSMFASPAEFRLRVSGFKDMLGNTMSVASPLIWSFATTGALVPTAVIDDFSTGTSKWKQPLSSSSTSGVDSASFSTSSGFALSVAGSSPGAGLLKIAWTKGGQNAFLHLAYDSAAASVAPLPFDSSVILQSYVFGDGRGTRLRFAVKTQAAGLASRWYAIDWVGWRLVQWQLKGDSSFAWNGPMWNSGTARFDGFQLQPSLTDTSGATFAVISNCQVMTLLVADVSGQTPGIPAAYRLHEAFPNPFNPSTSIRYELSAEGFVSLAVYDILGREVAVLDGGRQPAGVHTASWRPASAASGVYCARLRVTGSAGTEMYSRTIKLLLMK